MDLGCQIALVEEHESLSGSVQSALKLWKLNPGESFHCPSPRPSPGVQVSCKL